MTREEAIKFFESLKDCMDKVAPVLSGDFEKGMEAIKEPLRLDKSRWKECPYCPTEKSWYGRPKYVRFCPVCGRPLTDEAWAELERRINGGKTDN